MPDYVEIIHLTYERAKQRVEDDIAKTKAEAIIEAYNHCAKDILRLTYHPNVPKNTKITLGGEMGDDCVRTRE